MDKKYVSRVISKEFLKDLKEGNLKELTNLVGKDKSLLMCFRGKYITIYYKGHSMFKIDKYIRNKEKNQYGHKISFDFRHARFTREWEKKWAKLEYIGYERIGNEIVSYTSKIQNNDFWHEAIGILKIYMDDYFDLQKKINYFKEGALENKKFHLERQRQQQIMSSNQDLENGYFIYDMEFSQANENKDVPKSGRFDMMAIKMNGENINIMFIELKSTLSACNDSETGVKQHYYGIKKYMSKEELIDIRKKEAEAIYKMYYELGLTSSKIKNINLEKSNTEVIIVLTDGAINYECDKSISILKLQNDNWRL